MISRQSFNNVLDFQNKFNKFVSDFKGEQTPQEKINSATSDYEREFYRKLIRAAQDYKE